MGNPTLRTASAAYVLVTRRGLGGAISTKVGSILTDHGCIRFCGPHTTGPYGAGAYRGGGSDVEGGGRDDLVREGERGRGGPAGTQCVCSPVSSIEVHCDGTCSNWHGVCANGRKLGAFYAIGFGLHPRSPPPAVQPKRCVRAAACIGSMHHMCAMWPVGCLLVPGRVHVPIHSSNRDAASYPQHDLPPTHTHTRRNLPTQPPNHAAAPA